MSEQCQGITVKGAPCRKPAASDGYCATHAPTPPGLSPEQAARAAWLAKRASARPGKRRHGVIAFAVGQGDRLQNAVKGPKRRARKDAKRIRRLGR